MVPFRRASGVSSCAAIHQAGQRPEQAVIMMTGQHDLELAIRAIRLYTEKFADAILASGREAGEKVWRLPMYDEYLSQLQTGPADLRSTGSRWGGAITAALFLGEFVPRELPWAHLDIAGTAWKSGKEKGATGRPVPLLMQFLINRVQ